MCQVDRLTIAQDGSFYVSTTLNDLLEDVRISPSEIPPIIPWTNMAGSPNLNFSQFWLQVDDSDPRIQYFGTWFSDSYSKPGPILAPGELNYGTVNGTNSTGSLIFTYRGGTCPVS